MNIKENIKMKGVFQDLTEQNFGLLKVIKRAANVEQECDVRTAWFVKCDCGDEFTTLAKYLQRGSRTSCDRIKCRAAWLEHPAHPENHGVEDYGTIHE